MTMADVMNGKGPNCPQDWNDVYAEYAEFLDKMIAEGRTKLGKQYQETRRAFCLTDMGYQINRQYIYNEYPLSEADKNVTVDDIPFA